MSCVAFFLLNELLEHADIMNAGFVAAIRLARHVPLASPERNSGRSPMMEDQAHNYHRPQTDNNPEAMELDLDRKMKRIRKGASWFYWIALLSFINSVIMFSGGNTTIVFGLGITQIANALCVHSQEMADTPYNGTSSNIHYSTKGEPAIDPSASIQIAIAPTAIAITVNVLVIGFFMSMGFFAQRRHGWAFLFGLLAYLFDSLLFLIIGDEFKIAFHAFALISIFLGFKSLCYVNRVMNHMRFVSG